MSGSDDTVAMDVVDSVADGRLGKVEAANPYSATDRTTSEIVDAAERYLSGDLFEP